MPNKYDNILKTIGSRIEAIANAEKVTHTELGYLSRELLDYVPESKDIGQVNRLLAVLNRSTYDYAVLFFTEFLPWKFDETAGMFTSMINGQRRIDEMLLNIKTHLELKVKDENGKEHDWNIHDWTRENVQPAVRKVDFNKNLVNLIGRAMAEKNADGTTNENRIGPVDVVNDVINAGITLDDMFAIVTKAHDAKVKAEEAAKKAAANENKPKRARKAKAAVTA